MSDQEFRVRVVAARGRSWLTSPMPFDDALAYLRECAESLCLAGDGPRLLAFPTPEVPIAFVRARDVTAVELVALPTPGRPPAAGGPTIGATA